MWPASLRTSLPNVAPSRRSPCQRLAALALFWLAGVLLAGLLAGPARGTVHAGVEQAATATSLTGATPGAAHRAIVQAARGQHACLSCNCPGEYEDPWLRATRAGAGPCADRQAYAAHPGPGTGGRPPQPRGHGPPAA